MMMNDRGETQFEYILFDLDETLYPREAGVMKAISDRILRFMTQKVGIPADDATCKKLEYYQEYGTVLRGLMEEYHINPEEYLSYVHDFDPREFLGASPPLDRMLREIPLRKVIFTNADANHSERVLGTLQVRDHFDLIIDIKALNYENKPRPVAYQRALDLLAVSGERCIIVDDTPRNLIPAKDLSMTTILINGGKKSIAVDYAVPTIFHVEMVVKSILPVERR
ncbi:MAG: pyrimidine 5'-nucleotidase [Anaerolineae bacterium]|nr:pyrimidine 5'-nucleotidase [Anaerolineae bacterium]